MGQIERLALFRTLDDNARTKMVEAIVEFFAQVKKVSAEALAYPRPVSQVLQDYVTGIQANVPLSSPENYTFPSMSPPAICSNPKSC